MIRTLRFSAALLSVLLVAACQNDQLNRSFANTPVDPLFARYVSMGNSITAGFQSGGINDSTQQQSYAVLLAHAMRSPFFVPSLTGMVGFWATVALNIPDFTRYARSQKAQVVGQAVGLPAAMVASCSLM